MEMGSADAAPPQTPAATFAKLTNTAATASEQAEAPRGAGPHLQSPAC